MSVPYKCPFCGKDLTGGKIPDEQKDLFDPSTGYFSKVLSVYDVHKDRTTSYKCPYCNGEWPKGFEPDPIQEKTKNRVEVPTSIRVKVLKRDGYKCVWCNKGVEDGAKIEVDDIIPLRSELGKTMSYEKLNHPDNLRTLCKQCNLGKSNLLDEELKIS